MKFRQFFEDCCESFVSPNETLCIAWIKALSLIFMHFQNNCNRFIKDYLCERSDLSCNKVRISLFVEPCMYINRSNVCLHQHNSLYISLKKKTKLFSQNSPGHFFFFNFLKWFTFRSRTNKSLYKNCGHNLYKLYKQTLMI